MCLILHRLQTRFLGKRRAEIWLKIKIQSYYSSVHRSCSVTVITYVTVRWTYRSNYENNKYTQNILTPVKYARHFTESEVHSTYRIQHLVTSTYFLIFLPYFFSLFRAFFTVLFFTYFGQFIHFIKSVQPLFDSFRFKGNFHFQRNFIKQISARN